MTGGSKRRRKASSSSSSHEDDAPCQGPQPACLPETEDSPLVSEHLLRLLSLPSTFSTAELLLSSHDLPYVFDLTLSIDAHAQPKTASDALYGSTTMEPQVSEKAGDAAVKYVSAVRQGGEWFPVCVVLQRPSRLLSVDCSRCTYRDVLLCPHVLALLLKISRKRHESLPSTLLEERLHKLPKEQLVALAIDMLFSGRPHGASISETLAAFQGSSSSIPQSGTASVIPGRFMLNPVPFTLYIQQQLTTCGSTPSAEVLHEVRERAILKPLEIAAHGDISSALRIAEAATIGLLWSFDGQTAGLIELLYELSGVWVDLAVRAHVPWVPSSERIPAVFAQHYGEVLESYANRTKNFTILTHRFLAASYMAKFGYNLSSWPANTPADVRRQAVLGKLRVLHEEQRLQECLALAVEHNETEWVISLANSQNRQEDAVHAVLLSNSIETSKAAYDLALSLKETSPSVAVVLSVHLCNILSLPGAAPAGVPDLKTLIVWIISLIAESFGSVLSTVPKDVPVTTRLHPWCSTDAPTQLANIQRLLNAVQDTLTEPEKCTQDIADFMADLAVSTILRVLTPTADLLEVARTAWSKNLKYPALAIACGALSRSAGEPGVQWRTVSNYLPSVPAQVLTATLLKCGHMFSAPPLLPALKKHVPASLTPSYCVGALCIPGGRPPALLDFVKRLLQTAAQAKLADLPMVMDRLLTEGHLEANDLVELARTLDGRRQTALALQVCMKLVELTANPDELERDIATLAVQIASTSTLDSQEDEGVDVTVRVADLMQHASTKCSSPSLFRLLASQAASTCPSKELLQAAVAGCKSPRLFSPDLAIWILKQLVAGGETGQGAVDIAGMLLAAHPTAAACDLARRAIGAMWPAVCVELVAKMQMPPVLEACLQKLSKFHRRSKRAWNDQKEMQGNADTLYHLGDIIVGSPAAEVFSLALGSKAAGTLVDHMRSWANETEITWRGIRLLGRLVQSVHNIGPLIAAGAHSRVISTLLANESHDVIQSQGAFFLSFIAKDAGGAMIEKGIHRLLLRNLNRFSMDTEVLADVLLALTALAEVQPECKAAVVREEALVRRTVEKHQSRSTVQVAANRLFSVLQLSSNPVPSGSGAAASSSAFSVISFEEGKTQVCKSFNRGEITELCLRISLRCPLGKCRIKTPAKGRDCVHPACFDLDTYLAFNARTTENMCPICRKPIRDSGLVLDEYMQTIVNDRDCTPETDSVEVIADGTWVFPLPSTAAPVGFQIMDLT